MKHRFTGISLLFVLTVSGLAQQREADNPRARQEWFYNQRTYPTGQIPLGARAKAIADMERIDRAARAARQRPLAATLGESLAATLDAATWTLIGPKPTVSDLGTNRVTSGRITALAIDPRDGNTVYLGAAEGGVWKSTDGGANWTPIGDDQPSLAIGSIALDPNNPDTVYVGTGEENFAYDSYYGAGILKSTNGGQSWTNIQGPFLHTYIGGLAVSPKDGNVLLAAVNNGIYRSSDGGQSWTRVMTGTGTSVVFDPTDGTIAYSALGNINGPAVNGVYRSSDAGQTWNAVRGSGANSIPTTNAGRIVIGISAATPTTIYAAVHNSKTDNLMDVYKSTDSGATWNATKAPDVCPEGQCWYDLAIAVDPKDANVVWVIGDLAISRSVNGGSTWAQPAFAGSAFTGPNGVGMHVDEHAIAFSADGSKIYIGNDGGVYSTTDVTTAPASQINWTELNDTLAITQFYPGFAVHPSNVNIAVGGTQDNRTQLYTGKIGWTSVTCGDGAHAAFDASLPSIVFGTCASLNNPVVRRSTDGGNNWLGTQYGINLDDRVDFIPSVVVDPSNAQIVYYGTFRIFQSRDAGGKFVAISPDLGSRTSDTIRAIAVAPSDSKTVYAGTSNPFPANVSITAAPKIQVTNNALDASPNWNDRSNGLPPRVITHITVDPFDAATAYATFSGFNGGSDTKGHVFKTTDSGNNWTDISGNLPNIPVNDLVVDQDQPNTLYIATDVGVSASTDGGATWTSVGNGLPKVVVLSLVLHRPTRTLRAATHGRSVWDISVPLAAKSQQPSITAVSPTTANAGGSAFTLSVTGANFGSGTVLRWNGSARTTNIVDSSHLTASIPAGDIAAVGRVSIDAFNPSRGAGVSNAVNLNIGPAPASASNAFVSAANPTGGAVLAPRSIASLFGTNLAGATVVADSLPPLPITLGGTTLSLAGNTLPLFFVSSGQINFQLPFITLTGPTPQTLTITQGQLSTSIQVMMAPFSPALFTTNSAGTGQASALIAGTASIVAPVGAFPGSRPAKKGEFISLFGTGMGDVRNRPGLGAPSPSNPLATTLTNPTVTIGGVNANVIFSGLAPGFVGLYQVNVQVPDTAPTGDAVQVNLSIGGSNANTVTIAIQ